MWFQTRVFGLSVVRSGVGGRVPGIQAMEVAEAGERYEERQR